MGNGRRLRRQLRHGDSSTEVAIVLGATHDGSEDQLAEVRKATHDSLIQLLGSSRRSGVRWALYGPDLRDAFLADYEREAGPRPDLRAWFDQHPNGYLVVAMADRGGAPWLN